MNNIDANAIVQAAEALASGQSTSAEWFALAATVHRYAESLAYPDPEIVTADMVTVGMPVKVRPFIQVAVSRSSSTPVQLPVAVPATVEQIHNDGALGPEYATVRFDPDLYGNRPWQSETAVHIVSRGELHAITCRCRACEGYA